MSPLPRSGYRSWTGAARALALAVDTAVGAAQHHDADAFDEALQDVRRLDRAQLLVVLGTATQQLWERAAPGGLDAEVAERALSGCLLDAAPWYPPLDEVALLRALTSGVGVHDPDDPDAPVVAPDAVLAHGLILLAHLATTTGTPLPSVLEVALAELHRSQTVELP